MNWHFHLFPVRASTIAGSVDGLAWYLFIYAAFFSILIFGLLIFFCIRYRRRDDKPPPATVSSVTLEIVWSVIPFCIAMVAFVWGARIYINERRVPPDAMEIDVIGKRWMWKIQHPEGRREIDELHIPVGRRVMLKMTSEDVIHSFFVPAFRTKQDVIPGRYTYEWFQATKIGEYHLFCSQLCGTFHASMVGRVIVMEPGDYQQWLQGAAHSPSMVDGGKALFERYGCASCHGQQAPTLAGLYGSTVSLEGGGSVKADDNYLRESILNPSAKIVAGYPPIMPTFKGQISEEQLLQIIAYIHSLKDAKSSHPPGTGGASKANVASSPNSTIRESGGQ
jgi:cytochrome c oxidase subunit 2